MRSTQSINPPLDRRSMQGLVWLILPLFFLPKLNLFTIEGQTAGLRLDDFFLAFIAILYAWIYAARQELSFTERFSSIEKSLGWILAISFFSVMTNALLYHAEILPLKANLAYALRLLEYYLFFYIGIMSIYFYRPERILGYFLLWNIFLMFLQKFQILGGFYAGNYLMISDRVVGVCSFPTEMGVVLNFLYAFLIFSHKNCWRLWGLTFLFGFLILMTGSRTPLAVITLLFFIRLWQTRSSQKIALLFLPIGIIVGILAISESEGIAERGHLFSMNNIKIFERAWEAVEAKRDVNVNEFNLNRIQNTDFSLFIRLQKWVLAIKVYAKEPWSWLQGAGPGFTGPALDGGLLRLLVETGLLGLFFWMLFVKKIAQISKPMFWVSMSFLLNMIFMDVYLSYKCMSLFFFIAGTENAKKENS